MLCVTAGCVQAARNVQDMSLLKSVDQALERSQETMLWNSLATGFLHHTDFSALAGQDIKIEDRKGLLHLN
jgi:hypothetical protein